MQGLQYFGMAAKERPMLNLMWMALVVGLDTGELEQHGRCKGTWNFWIKEWLIEFRGCKELPQVMNT